MAPVSDAHSGKSGTGHPHQPPTAHHIHSETLLVETPANVHRDIIIRLTLYWGNPILSIQSPTLSTLQSRYAGTSSGAAPAAEDIGLVGAL